MPLSQHQLKIFLDQKVKAYNTVQFIAGDPIAVPHKFTLKQDVEIAAFFAAIIAWGNRTTIMQNASRIMEAMDHAPYQFITQHKEKDLKRFLDIKHRTFNATDLLYFIHFLQLHYRSNTSLEDAFISSTPTDMRLNLTHFHDYVFSFEHPERTRKHIATPSKNSACKRLNMMLRWMVRNDKQGVDFGIWKKLEMRDLICPLDIHVSNVAYRLGLLPNTKADWKQAFALTSRLKQFDEKDPCKYDYALFGLGAEERVR